MDRSLSNFLFFYERSESYGYFAYVRCAISHRTSSHAGVQTDSTLWYLMVSHQDLFTIKKSKRAAKRGHPNRSNPASHKSPPLTARAPTLSLSSPRMKPSQPCAPSINCPKRCPDEAPSSPRDRMLRRILGYPPKLQLNPTQIAKKFSASRRDRLLRRIVNGASHFLAHMRSLNLMMPS